MQSCLHNLGYVPFPLPCTPLSDWPVRPKAGKGFFEGPLVESILAFLRIPPPLQWPPSLDDQSGVKTLLRAVIQKGARVFLEVRKTWGTSVLKFSQISRISMFRSYFWKCPEMKILFWIIHRVQNAAKGGIDVGWVMVDTWRKSAEKKAISKKIFLDTHIFEGNEPPTWFTTEKKLDIFDLKKFLANGYKGPRVVLVCLGIPLVGLHIRVFRPGSQFSKNGGMWENFGKAWGLLKTH